MGVVSLVDPGLDVDGLELILSLPQAVEDTDVMAFQDEDGGLWQKISLHRAPAPWRFGLETRDRLSVADSHLTGLGGVPSLV